MDTRPSPIAGRWYPSDPAELRQMVTAQLDSAQADIPAGQVIALITPHAGLIYSGPVAAYAFKTVQGQTVETVVIVCPSHFHAEGAILTSGHAAYQTPLGLATIDQALVHALRAELAATLQVPPEQALVAVRRDREHAIEIELPFLQLVLAAGFQIIPIMLRDQSVPVTRALGAALAQVLAGRPALIVGSSDLSHYHPQPVALKLDAEMLRAVETGDPLQVMRAQAESRGFACGYGAMAATLWAASALGATRVKVLNHATSGDVSGDYEAVVGYGAAMIWRG